MAKRLRILCLFLFTFVYGAAVSESARAFQVPNITGVYSVNGTNPGGGGRYGGTATIAKDGEKYRMSWKVGTSYTGVGKLDGTVFTVEWGNASGHVGTVTYVLQPGGVLKGTWSTAQNPNVLGTEILTPQR